MNLEINLTDGDDEYIVEQGLKEWFTLRALKGNDRVVIRSGGNVVGGPGNDTIIDETGQPWSAAVYWDSPGPIWADLQKGTVQDGWGNTDTLVDIHNIQTGGRDGDMVLGSTSSDYVWLNGFGGAGRATVDLRDGEDRVTLGGLISDYSLNVASDGRRIELSKNGYTAVLNNVETLQFWDFNTSQQYTVPVLDLVDLSKLGTQVLLATGQNGWSAGSRGQSVALTYSFLSALPTYGGQEGGAGFVAPSPAYQQAVREILQRLQAETGLRFTEVTDTPASYGQLRFGANQQSATKGYAYMPGSSANDRVGDVWMDLESLQRLAEGEEGRQALMHEIGHALGLSHPTDEGAATGTTLLNRWNNNSYTLMSSRQTAPNMWQSWFAAFDIQALINLYGPAPALVQAKDDFFRLSDANGRLLWTLHDTGGNDVVDGSNLSLGMTLDLRPGGFSSVGLNAYGSASWNNLFTDYGTWVERVFDTPYDDVIWGNSQDNYFYWNSGNDLIDGQGGRDTLIINHPSSQFTVSFSDYTQLFQLSDNTGVLGSLSLSNVERLWFRDKQFTLAATSPTSIESSVAETVSALIWDRTAPTLEQVGSPAPYQRIAAGEALKLSLNESLVLGDGTVQLTHLGKGKSQLFSKALNNLKVSGNMLTVGQPNDLDLNASYKLEFVGNVVTDASGNPMAPTAAQTFRVGNLDSLYQFFIVAFAAPPGGNYMEQLAEAYNYFQSVPTIVDIFTTKSQFTSVYPSSLSHKELAAQLVANIVKTSASEAARASAAKDIETTLELGWSVGKILYTVFGNLASKPTDDLLWSGTARQFSNQVAVAKYLTEAMDYRNDKLPDLQHILAGVTPNTDVSSPDKLASLIGVALDSLNL